MRSTKVSHRRSRWNRRSVLQSHGGGAAGGYIAESVRNGELALRFSIGLPDLVADALFPVGGGLGRSRIEEILNPDVDFADSFVAQSAGTDELDVEGEAVILQRLLLDDELHGEIPGGAGASVVISRGLDFLVVVGVPAAGDREDGVNRHLIEQVDVFKLPGGQKINIQSTISILH